MTRWPFLQSAEVARQLATLAASAWGHPMARIEADLARRAKELIAAGLEADMPGGDLLEGVGCTLGLVP